MENGHGKTALITGASSGIGREIAEIHASRGGNVVAVARSADALHALKEELERVYAVTVHVIVQDLSAPDAAQAVYDAVNAAGITVDYLINNAGFGGLGKFHEREWDADGAMIRVNVMALTQLTRLFLPDFVARNAGRILNVSSTASLMPGPLQAVYYATKAYVTSLSNALNEEVRDAGVTVTALLPGATATKFAAVSGMEKTALFKSAASARSVAEDGYTGMLAGKLNVMSAFPLPLRIAAFFMPFIPKRMLLTSVRKMQEAP